jgi:hypothetical protein
MIEMTVREKNVVFANRPVLDEGIAKCSQSGTSVKNNDALSAAHFDARGIAAIADGFWSGTGDASSDSPESNAHHGSVLHIRALARGLLYPGARRLRRNQ